MGDLLIGQVIPPGPDIYVGVMEEMPKPTLTGGWSTLARPKRKSATEWAGFDPISMTVPIMIDGFIDDRVVEAEVLTIEGFMRTTPAGEPPVLRLSGPVPHTELLWVLNQIDYIETQRRPIDNGRIRQSMTLTFLEYVPIEIVTAARVTPAVAAAGRASTAAAGGGGIGSDTGGGTYTVKSGDTLSGIASRTLGNSARWTEIADLNGIRDPKSLKVGQVLRLPGGSTPAPAGTRVSQPTKASSSGSRTTVNTESAARAVPGAGRKVPF